MFSIDYHQQHALCTQNSTIFLSLSKTWQSQIKHISTIGISYGNIKFGSHGTFLISCFKPEIVTKKAIFLKSE